MSEAPKFEHEFDFNYELLCGNCTDAFIYAMSDDPQIAVSDTPNGILIFRITDDIFS